jgi:hypothetical protein
MPARKYGSEENRSRRQRPRPAAATTTPADEPSSAGRQTGRGGRPGAGARAARRSGPGTGGGGWPPPPGSDPAAADYHASWREQQRRKSEEMARRGLPDAAELNLDRYSRKVQRALYRLTVAHYWTSRDPAAAESDADEAAPRYSPEEAGLRILFALGRWWATYRALEDDDSDYLPAADHQPLLRITYDPAEPVGLHFNPC